MIINLIALILSFEPDIKCGLQNSVEALRVATMLDFSRKADKPSAKFHSLS
jgi:hypothetical protein